MKTKEELEALKEELETLNKKLAELSEAELAQVAGGGNDVCIAPVDLKPYIPGIELRPDGAVIYK